MLGYQWWPCLVPPCSWVPHEAEWHGEKRKAKNSSSCSVSNLGSPTQKELCVPSSPSISYTQFPSLFVSRYRCTTPQTRQADKASLKSSISRSVRYQVCRFLPSELPSHQSSKLPSAPMSRCVMSNSCCSCRTYRSCWVNRV